MALKRYKTAGELVNEAARRLGLIAADLADPFASTDANVALVCQLVTDVGQSLAEDHSLDWRHLHYEHTITGDGATTTWGLPADFGGMVPQTGWNRTDRYPLQGPLTPQTWQYRAANPTTPVYAEFRLDTNQLRTVPAFPAAADVRFEYRSRAWVRTAAQTLGNGNTLGPSGHDAPTASADHVLFDPLLFRLGLVLAYRRARGYETDAAEQDFQKALDNAGARNTTAPVLSLSRRRGLKLIDITNVPDTGYGS